MGHTQTGCLLSIPLHDPAGDHQAMDFRGAFIDAGHPRVPPVALRRIGLGIAGLVQRERKRMFSVLGLVFNAVAVLGVLGIMILGVAAS